MTDAVVDCTFCRVATGKTESSIVCEDELTIAFLDVRPFANGHTLVIPRRHIPDVYGLDDVMGGALMATVARVARALRDTTQPDGLNVWQSTGTAAGQEVFHLHVHVVPRHVDDGLLRFDGLAHDVRPRAELDALAARIAERAR